MKLKGLPNRAYNILFHTHTVSGIAISFALYVIFFAGAFTLFRNEFYQWENPEARIPLVKTIDYNAVVDQIKAENPAFKTENDIRMVLPTEANPLLLVRGQLSKNKKEVEYFEAIYNPVKKTYTLSKGNEGAASTIGETLFRLHYLQQIPAVGMYLAGLVALFFAFASITGLLIHWRNIFSKFYGFSLKGSWKQIWTNSHTVFGLLGLPFQLMYAITGTFYIFSILILIPGVLAFYGGNQKKALDILRPDGAIVLKDSSPQKSYKGAVLKTISQLEKENPDFGISSLSIRHYDREDAILTARISKSENFTGNGMITVSLKDGKKLINIIPGSKTYVQSVLEGIGRLHFGEFGGIFLKTIYFILALFTCFVILSGVLIWKEARNKKEYTAKQKKFHHRVTMWYLSVCLMMLPAIALLFILEQTIALNSHRHTFYVNTAFFSIWFLLTIRGATGLKEERKLMKFTLILLGIFSVFIPLINGLMTGDWIWTSAVQGNFYVMGVDLFWLVTGIVSFGILYLMDRNSNRAISLKGSLNSSSIRQKPANKAEV
ncbi:Uncharacterized iron-regulated membrane protein [Pseudarcicella hirudinis]|uniref:Uncharacterized iron-regulated membrane protein n=1 Tax=Pseudarcicella hirudinis TaxID=1079859 RepID=A0A1I5N1G3_9BACT|nr:PepSY-associated TM helix domain-containing protein [Pseudarcicella hirudinis]SFP15537.1 Uncharacterized iron-regulated membrane protein [Pseudarcicella hirudinis]